MFRRGKKLTNLLIILGFGLIPSITCQFFIQAPTSKSIHVKNFRYGKDPSVIRCNRGDTLKLTFSTNDTGHSFFLEEFDMDVKVNPASEQVQVFKTSDPTLPSVQTKEVNFIARHKGLLNYLVAKSNYRCHVWCGPMHAFEQGKLVIFPNTLLCFSLGAFTGILFLWIKSLLKNPSENEVKKETDILEKSSFLKKLTTSRLPQIIVMFFALGMIYLVLMTTLFGTKVSGRNLGVLLMWAVWLFLLVAILTPLLGRSWCTICPLPIFGDWLQRRSLFYPDRKKTKDYNNKFHGLFLKWPDKLKNSWLRLIVFLILSTFSTTLVANPKATGITILLLILVPTIMSLIWELRAFCRYVCPASIFMAPFSGMSTIALKCKSQEVCDNCKPHFCEKGSATGWACPYGINVGKMDSGADCGLCMECIRSCSYKNVSIFKKPFGSDSNVRSTSEAWLVISIFAMSIVYSILYLGVWPVLRDYVNILDMQNWDLFGIYSLTVWTSVLLIMPGILYALSFIGHSMSRINTDTKKVFLNYVGTLLPLGLMLWISFVVPMLFVNVTFIAQSASDPFGWGWDFFGTANIPWHQFIPQAIPWIQAILVLSGFSISLKNLRGKWQNQTMNSKQRILISAPMAVFLSGVAVFMIFFFTN